MVSQQVTALIDLGFNDATPDHELPPGISRQPGIVTGQAALGITPNDITHVAITHAHGDHVEGATTRHRDGAQAVNLSDEEIRFLEEPHPPQPVHGM